MSALDKRLKHITSLIKFNPSNVSFHSPDSVSEFVTYHEFLLLLKVAFTALHSPKYAGMRTIAPAKLRTYGLLPELGDWVVDVDGVTQCNFTSVVFCHMAGITIYDYIDALKLVTQSDPTWNVGGFLGHSTIGYSNLLANLQMHSTNWLRVLSQDYCEGMHESNVGDYYSHSRFHIAESALDAEIERTKPTLAQVVFAGWDLV